MKNKYFFAVVLMLFYNTIFGQKINKDFIDGEIYVKVKQKPSSNSTKQVNFSTELLFLQKYATDFVLIEANKSFFTKESENLQKIYRLKITNPEKIDAIIEKLKNDAGIEYIEKVPLRKIITTPNDPSVGSQWSLTKIKAFEAWDVNAGVNDIVVAVVDNAFQTNHVDLQANMLAGRDVSDNDNDPNPPNATFAHGTHVAGILSAVSNNNTGIAAASNNRIKILPVKATPDAGNANNIYQGFEGIVWAADNGAKIISLSWGAAGYFQAEQEVIDYAASKGILIVAAAGNDNSSIEHYPSAYNHVIAVASTDSDDKRSSFSNYGTWVDISAPGRGILSTLPFDTYGSFNGTSMATPLVSSTLGYIWACYPSLSSTQVENLLKTTVDNIDTQNSNQIGLLGTGRINLYKAILCSSIGLSSANITPNGSTYICSGESVVLNANSGSGFNYSWLKDGVNQNISIGSLTATEQGSYKVTISQGDCSIFSSPINVTFNTLKTPTPSVTSREIAYCGTLTTGNGLLATAINCNYGGPTTFNYNGPTVGYDGFEKSGDNPSIVVSNLGGKVSHLKIAITWQKKDGGNKNSCGTPDGGASPFNEEVSFKLKSPNGTVITLLPTGIYNKGTVTSGLITTSFEDGATVIADNSLPIAGIFAPNQALSTFNNEIPIGIWTLLPEDDNFSDPLCVQGFSVTLTTDSPNQPSQVSWWNSSTGGSQLFTGTEYIPSSTNSVGTQTYYAQAQCTGLCPSNRVAVKLKVNPVPLIYAFPVSSSLSNDKDFKAFTQNNHIQFIKNVKNEYVLYDSSNVNQTFSIGDTPPLTSPISICPSKNYLLLAVGCPTNNITWSNSENSQSIFIVPTSPITYYATCNQSWGNCSAINSNTINFVSTTNDINISEEVKPNNQQNFVAQSINANNEILTPAKINYKASQKVILNPGFSVSGNSVFTAFIGNGCNN